MINKLYLIPILAGILVINAGISRAVPSLPVRGGTFQIKTEVTSSGNSNRVYYKEDLLWVPADGPAALVYSKVVSEIAVLYLENGIAQENEAGLLLSDATGAAFMLRLERSGNSWTVDGWAFLGSANELDPPDAIMESASKFTVVSDLGKDEYEMTRDIYPRGDFYKTRKNGQLWGPRELPNGLPPKIRVKRQASNKITGLTKEQELWYRQAKGEKVDAAEFLRHPAEVSEKPEPSSPTTPASPVSVSQVNLLNLPLTRWIAFGAVMLVTAVALAVLRKRRPKRG